MILVCDISKDKVKNGKKLVSLYIKHFQQKNPMTSFLIFPLKKENKECVTHCDLAIYIKKVF
jgi:helix-turn-helix protein